VPAPAELMWSIIREDTLESIEVAFCNIAKMRRVTDPSKRPQQQKQKTFLPSTCSGEPLGTGLVMGLQTALLSAKNILKWRSFAILSKQLPGL